MPVAGAAERITPPRFATSPFRHTAAAGCGQALEAYDLDDPRDAKHNEVPLSPHFRAQFVWVAAAEHV